MATLTKKRKAALAKFDASKIYSLQEATQIVKQVSNTKFDGTVDIAVGGMTCSSCVNRVERKLGKLPGVTAETPDL